MGLKDSKGKKQDSILQPLKDRGGIVFPYTPNLYLQASVDYNEACNTVLTIHFIHI